MTLSLQRVPSEDQGKPVYCWFRFEGDDTHRFIQIDVTDIRAGDYDTYTKDCQEGYLRISDEEVCSSNPTWLPPTTLCGHYEQGTVRVKRITRTPSAFVEFRLERGRPSKGYEFDVTFMDTGEEEEEQLPYGHLQRQDGRVLDTRCDWLIPVNECIGTCRVVSPGFPGIYAPNIRCQYLFTHFNDARVELKLGSGKFDMKQSENCTEDYVEVYDGMSAFNPLIGRFCGRRAEPVISKGSSLLLVFQSGPGGPPWDYSGFDAKFNDRWRDNHEGGQKVAGSVCDWLFESADTSQGDLHPADFFLEPGTKCHYRFKGAPNERVQLKIIVYEQLARNCSEKLEIFDGDQLRSTICRADLKRPQQTFEYNTTGPEGSIRFTSYNGQISKLSPPWMYYTFWTDPNYTQSNPADTSGQYTIDLKAPYNDVIHDPPETRMETQQDAPPDGSSRHHLSLSCLSLTAFFASLFL